MNTKLKVKLEAQNAKPGAPLGPILGQAGIPLKNFVDEFNLLTKKNIKGIPLKILIIKKSEKKFNIINKGPLLSFLLEIYNRNPSKLNFYKLIKIKNYYQNKNFVNEKNEYITYKNIKSTLINNSKS